MCHFGALESLREGVWALVLTYGERFTILRKTLSGLRAAGIDRVFLVSNGTPYDLQARLAADTGSLPKQIEVLRAEENLGSAGGYRLGIEAARCRPEVQCLWLFDDDNLPNPDALDPLLRVDTSMRVSDDAPHHALLSYRPDKRYLERLVSGEPVARVYPRPGSFCGFHVGNLSRRLVSGAARRRAGRPPISTTSLPTAIPIPWAPWGGLWLPRRTFMAMGLPLAELFLYADDTEYTHRITASAGRLLLVPNSIVKDVDVVRFGTPRTTIYRTLYEEPSDARVYYLMRNQTYFERFFYAPDLRAYDLNRTIFMGRLAAQGLRLGRPRRLILLHRAIRDGLAGRLGRRRELGL